MKISRKDEDFRIYVEDESGNYISSDFIIRGSGGLDKRLTFRIDLSKVQTLGKECKFDLDISIEELKTLTELLKETIKYL